MSHKNATQQIKMNPLLYQSKTYQEIINYLDSKWHASPHIIIQKLNQSLGNLSSKLSCIIITGTNEVNTTIHYLEEISKTKNITTGSFSSPHSISYNERFKINGETISNDTLTNLANKVLQIANDLQLDASSKDILTAMALLLFHEKKVELAIFKQDHDATINKDPVTICLPIILGIPHIIEATPEQTQATINSIIKGISNNTHVISADQSKSSLKSMAYVTKQNNGIWAMPIRKAAPLLHPFEQLFGRYAALADRIIQTYLEHHAKKDITTTDLLSLPTKTEHHADATKSSLSMKKIKNLQLSSIDFWQSINNDIPNKFEIIKQNNETIVLNNAHNIDDFNSLFLGIRLLHYQHNFDSISFVIGSIQGQCNEHSFIKLLRSYFKKQITIIGFCPVSSSIGEKTGTSWDIQSLINITQYTKLTAITQPTLASLLHEISQLLKEPKEAHQKKNNLIVIAGSQEIITQFYTLQNKTKTISLNHDSQHSENL